MNDARQRFDVRLLFAFLFILITFHFWFGFAVILLLYAAVTVVTSRRLKKDPCNGLPDDTFIVNPKGCKYFLSCKSGVGVGAYCPHGLWFNPKDRICDLPAQVDCHLDDPVTTTTTTELPTRTWTPSLSTIRPTTSIASTSSSTTATMTTTTQLPVIEDDQEEIVCPMHDLDVIQFVASKINCRQYYICYHGRAVLQECSEKLHWNAKANKCDRPKDAACNVSYWRSTAIASPQFWPIFLFSFSADYSKAADAISQVPEQWQSLLSPSNRMRLLYLLSQWVLFDTTVPILSSLGRIHWIVQMASVHTLRHHLQRTTSSSAADASQE